MVACSRRIDHFHNLDASVGGGDLDAPVGDVDAMAMVDGPTGPVCPQPTSTPATACAKAGFGWPTALSGDAHTMARLADVNADGKLDLVSSEISRNRVAVAFGRGDGTFQAQAYYAVSSEPASIDVGDLDVDGDIDIVIGSQASADLSILLKTATARLQPRRHSRFQKRAPSQSRCSTPTCGRTLSSRAHSIKR